MHLHFMIGLSLFATPAMQVSSQGLRTDAGFHLTYQELIASDGAAFDGFGSAVSMSGDHALVGAPSAAAAGVSAGAVYAHRFLGGVWHESEKLVSPSPQNLGRFGYSVSIDGDVAIVGEPGLAYFTSTTGLAHVFRFDGTKWRHEQVLAPSNGFLGDTFGWAVSIEGDLAVVGAPSASPIYYQQGAVYVFRFDGTTWNEEASLVPLLSYTYDYLGSSVAQSGDVLLLGAPGNGYPNATGAGAVWLYRWDGTAWREEQVIRGPGERGDQFGDSVALDGDLAVVGVYAGNGQYHDSGTAMLYRHGGSAWGLEATLCIGWPRGKSDMQFGDAVDVRGNRVVVGASAAEKSAFLPCGQAYSFGKGPGGWRELRTYSPVNGATGDRFGASITLDGGRVFVGAERASPLGQYSGEAYAY